MSEKYDLAADPNEAELSDEELDRVAGGWDGSDPNQDPPPPPDPDPEGGGG